MPSPSPQRDSEAERGLNVGTVAIASAASAAAALIVSQLWIAGTWIAAAVTPALVAVIAEMISRPTRRIRGAITSDRSVPFPAGEDPAPHVSDAPEPDPDAPPRRLGGRPEPDPNAPRRGAPPSAGPVPYRVYRAGGAAPHRRRRIAVGVVFATAAIAFVIAGLAITVPELIAGQSIGGSDRGSTFLGGKPRNQRDSPAETGRSNTVTVTTPAETVERTAPEERQLPRTQTTTTPTETTPQATTPLEPRAAPAPETTTPAP